MITPPTEQLTATYHLARGAMAQGDFAAAAAVLHLLDAVISGANAVRPSRARETLLLQCLADRCECELELGRRSEAAALARRAVEELDASKRGRTWPRRTGIRRRTVGEVSTARRTHPRVRFARTARAA